MTIAGKLKEIDTLIEHKRLLSAKTSLENALKKYSDPNSQALLNYQMGVLYWGEIGDGEKARYFFKHTTDLYTKFAQLKNSIFTLPTIGRKFL